MAYNVFVQRGLPSYPPAIAVREIRACHGLSAGSRKMRDMNSATPTTFGLAPTDQLIHGRKVNVLR